VHKKLCVFVCLLILTVLCGTSEAQTRVVERLPRYSRATESAIHGIVQEIPQAHRRQAPAGSYFVLATSTGPLDVQLGPFFRARDHFAPGQIVSVIGSLANVGNTKVLLARQITVGKQVFVVRNLRGFPISRRATLAQSSLTEDAR